MCNCGVIGVFVRFEARIVSSRLMLTLTGIIIRNKRDNKHINELHTTFITHIVYEDDK